MINKARKLSNNAIIRKLRFTFNPFYVIIIVKGSDNYLIA